MKSFVDKRSARGFAKRTWLNFLQSSALESLHGFVDQTISELADSFGKCRCLISFPLDDEYPLVDRLRAKQWPHEIYLPAIQNPFQKKNRSETTLENFEMEFRQVSIQKISPQYLDRHHWGFLMPTKAAPALQLPLVAKTDLIIVPALGLTTEGIRLGRGKGFYDRFFAATVPANARPLCVSILPAELTQLSFPTEEHDLRLDWLITEAGVRKFVSRSR